LIKRNFQFNIVMSFIVLGGALATATFAAARILLARYADEIPVREVLVIEAQTFFISIILVAVFSYIFGLWSSHKIAGPLYRIEHGLWQIESGDLTANVFFRKGDFLHETGEAFNRAAESVRVRVKSGREGLEEGARILAGLEEKAAPADRERIARVRELISRSINAFTVAPPEEKPAGQPQTDNPS
jgi:methyl-accepting chemotaxis protein